MMKKISLSLFLIYAAFAYLVPCRAQGLPSEEYTVGVDDVLEINILQPEKLSNLVTVSQDGSISFPYINNVTVNGMTLNQIRDEIQKRLADGYMKYPLVTVSLKESRSRKFFVYGDVAKPGAYPIQQDTTVLKAITMAGGFLKSGSSCQVKILRQNPDENSQAAIDIDLKGALAGSAKADLIIQPQDTIMVTQGKFFVYGEVTHPGVYPLEDDITVLKAIAIAGGFTKYGSASRVKLLRPKTDGAGYQTIKINIKEIMNGSSQADLKLEQGDTVMVLEGVI
jgi:polysaccharide export outer membrane protein